MASIRRGTRLPTPAAAPPIVDALEDAVYNGNTVHGGGVVAGGIVLMGTAVGSAAQNNSPTSGFSGWRAASAVNTVNGRSSNWAYLPTARNWGAVAADARDLRRYRLEGLLQRDALGIDVRLEFGAKTADNPMSSSSVVGIVFALVPATYGAELVVLHRLSSGAALTTTQTGVEVTAGVPVRCALELLEGATPTLTASIDGADVLELEGLANMPVTALGSSNILTARWIQGVNPGGATGVTDWLHSARYRIWEQ